VRWFAAFRRPQLNPADGARRLHIAVAARAAASPMHDPA
jgi:hypothetical protein